MENRWRITFASLPMLVTFQWCSLLLFFLPSTSSKLPATHAMAQKLDSVDIFRAGPAGLQAMTAMDWVWSNVLQGVDCNMTLLFSFGQVRPAGLADSVAVCSHEKLCWPWFAGQHPTVDRCYAVALHLVLVQAAACADVGAALMSPFVGRILDWYKAKYNRWHAMHSCLCVLAYMLCVIEV